MRRTKATSMGDLCQSVKAFGHVTILWLPVRISWREFHFIQLSRLTCRLFTSFTRAQQPQSLSKQQCQGLLLSHVVLIKALLFH